MSERQAIGDSADDAAFLHLDNQLCFALQAAARAISRTYRERLAALGLTHPQYLVLLVLWEQDGLSVSAIGDRLMLDSGTLTPLLKRLEALGIVTRARGSTDERQVIVSLTEAGFRLRGAAAEAREHVVCRLAMSEEEINDLRFNLMGIVARLSHPESHEPASTTRPRVFG
ncbi:MAG: MarR family transcriptional regulator [Hyphomicrobiaceae bacterium]|nr:MarR family transcriptional regulator [Hyphomicrobiaceae bacterium]